MKKLILLLSVLSIFLIPSFSFADSTAPGSYTIEIKSSTISYTLLCSDNALKYKNSNLYIPAYTTVWGYNGAEWRKISVPSDSYTLIPISNITSSSYDVYYSDSNDVFFSPPALIQVVEELPPVVAQAGGTVLSVALTGFGILLAVSLIPRLVKRFLY